MALSGESPEYIDNILASLREKERDFKVGDNIYSSLGNRSLIAIEGPTGSGKTTVTTEVVRLDPDFYEIETETTRQHRDGDPIVFHTGVSFTDFINDIVNEEFVNFNVIGRNAYGTKESGFKGPFAIGPMMSRSITQMLDGGLDEAFKDLVVIRMLVEEMEYERRLRAERMHFSDFRPRIIQAGESKEFAEAHIGTRWLHFVESTSAPDGATKAARKIINIANRNSGEFITDSHARKMLEGMDRAMRRVAADIQ